MTCLTCKDVRGVICDLTGNPIERLSVRPSWCPKIKDYQAQIDALRAQIAVLMREVSSLTMYVHTRPMMAPKVGG